MNRKVKKIPHGGKRKKAGRKPVEDKKEAVVLYVRKSVIELMGIDVIKERCYKSLEQ